MSCRIKKLLFFMVLSIVCNSTFSADNPGSSNRTAECIENVKLVYNDDTDPCAAFYLSMHLISFNFIKSMKNTVELSNSLLQQFEKLKDDFSEERIWIFTAIANEIGNRNIQITESARTDIAGYFERLIVNFETIYEDFINAANSPAKFCEEWYKIDFGFNFNQYSVEWLCRRTLSRLLEISDEELNGIDAVYAFKHCYLNYRYLNFSDDSIFSESGSSSTIIPITHQLLNVLRSNYIESSNNILTIPNDQKLIQDLQKQIAMNYFSMLMGEINRIAVATFDNNSLFIQTVEKYCSSEN